MEDKLKELIVSLDVEIARLQSSLATLEPTSDEYKSVTARLKEVMDVRLEYTKNDREIKQKEEQLAFEKAKNLDECINVKKDRLWTWIRTGLDILVKTGQIVGAIIMTRETLRQGYLFEETGSCTSTTFREARRGLVDMKNDVTRK